MLFSIRKGIIKYIDNITCPRARGSEMLEDVLKKYGAEEVTAMEVYSDMFHLGEHMIQKVNEEPGEFKANPLGYWKNDDKASGHYRIMFEDTFEETLKELQEADFSILNGISYYGRKNVQSAASKMYAMIFDLDGITDNGIEAFMRNLHSAYAIYPMPQYVILSGHGVHLYYVFDEPISLYPNIKLQLKEFKYALTNIIWNRYVTSKWEKPQFQGINQGFRVIGGKTKIEGVRSRAFRINKHPITMEEMNEYVATKSQVDMTKLYSESKMTLSEAKMKFPEWYQKRVIEKIPKGTWQCKEDLYNWWFRQINSTKTSVGHRYFCIMCLAIYASKSGIPYEKLKDDAMSLLPFFNEMGTEQEPFLESDIESALECYDERYITFPIKDISKISGIPIEKNKRKYQKQAEHLEEARAIRDIRMKRQDRDWRDGNGRPEGSGTKKSIIAEWRKLNPEGTKAECVRETGISKMTVYKWWDGEESAARYKTKSKGKQTVEEPTFEYKTLTTEELDMINKNAWHKSLPEHYVVEGSPDMMDKMFLYASQGIRSVDILSQEEHEFLLSLFKK